jgi:hypothetical protein
MGRVEERKSPSTRRAFSLALIPKKRSAASGDAGGFHGTTNVEETLLSLDKTGAKV